jgi:uncharacterized protein (DUF58 family)
MHRDDIELRTTVALGAGDAFPGWTPQFAAALQRLAIPNRARAHGQRQGDVRAATRGRALEFAEHRPYQPGDEPRLVDWRAYARFDRLYLKQHEEERARTVTILVDGSASMDWGDADQGDAGWDDGGSRRGDSSWDDGESGRGRAHKGRFARRLAAALTWIAVSRHDAVTVSILRDGGARRLQPISSLAGAGLCFRQLAEVREAGRTGLAAAVRDALASSPRGPTVLVSDLLEPGWPEALAALGGSGEAAMIQVLAPAEWSPPLGEEVELQDAETGDTVLTRLGTPELTAYAEQLEAFLERVRGECRRLGIAAAALDSGTPLQDVLFRQLPAAGILEE